ncbi:hypothetical protein GII30_21665 [Gordonia amarae]|uniref:Secreted protein n=2 Tax=Gordonia amarae TaxID=36821 RepID=G7GM86_9ACTN|nr:hypothetical protein [Gordonia amarae]MCS3881054.1 type IV secretory pathway TrbL component [Gordonia amarae]QHN19281.1 hypothetical protein GII35_21960 [Gordonia amarae]QHN23757.1 hypothetical protein GII34_21460 [Gordonia amarae]QHN41417.1 hypothetical protein GII30_21665 [Gordonia amarae]GAB04711.1 hypothetical protein GOAMR_20_02610 [Gordonia amarae NBRC 15530]
MTRRSPRIAVFAATAALAVTLAACGSEDDATDASSSTAVASSTASESASATSSVSSSAKASKTPEETDDLRTENPSAPIVGGRVPASRRSSHKPDPNESAPTPSSGECGTTQGPDGALHIVILAGDVNCSEAKGLTKEYNAKAIATGQQKKVGDWTCGPSQVHGLLAACQKDQSVIGFTP